jgi:hypothetical protein
MVEIFLITFRYLVMLISLQLNVFEIFGDMGFRLIVRGENIVGKILIF